jgi:O-antigen ligase
MTMPIISARFRLMLAVLTLTFWTAICFTPPTDDYAAGIMGGGITHPFYIIKILGVILPVALSLLYIIASHGFRGAMLRTLFVQRHVYYYVIFSGLALIWAYQPATSAAKLIIFVISLFAQTVLISLYFHGMHHAAYRNIIRHTCFAFLIYTMFFFVNYLGGLVQGLNVDDMREAVCSPYVHPNIAAAIVIFGSVLLYFIVTASARTPQLIKVVIIATSILITLLVLNGLNSRGGLAAAIMSIGIAVMLRSSLIGFVAGLGVIAVVLLFIAFSQEMGSSALASLSRSGDASEVLTLTNRSLIWSTMFTDYNLKDALLGYGYASVSPDVGVEISSTGYDYVFTFGAHNMFFQTLLGGGIVGLLLLLLILLRIGHYALRRHMSVMFRERPHIPVIIPFIYVLIQGVLEHLFGLNLTPAFAVLLLVFTIGMLDDTLHNAQLTNKVV